MEKLALSQRIAEDETKKCQESLWYFMENYVQTLDEHDSNSPIKSLPKKEYLKELSNLFLIERLLLIEKSRQMLVTWMGMAYCLWLAMFHQGKRIFVQSKKEQDANNLIDRIKFIYEHLPDWFKEKYKANPFSYLKLEFGKWNSIIQGIPQGAEQLRQYTVSLVFSDEMAFQEKSEEAFIAAKPTITGGGQYIGVSTPNFKEFFYRLIQDRI